MLVLSLAFGGAGCPCVNSAVNASPELRWWLFSNFGASKLCPEMLKRGVPLKLPQLGNASVGRFFPNQCFVQVDETKKAVKTAIFRERTIHQPKAALAAETAQDALVLAGVRRTHAVAPRRAKKPRMRR